MEQIDFLKHINHLIFIDRLTIKRLSSMKRGLSISHITQNMKVSQSLLDLSTTSTSNIREIDIYEINRGNSSHTVSKISNEQL